MRLSIVAENSTTSPSLTPEYGLSMHLDLEGLSILVDTAQGIGLFSNAFKMGIDLRRLDMVALSHGHFDHVGGFASLYSYCGSIPLWGHPKINSLHCRLEGEKKRFIGFHLNKDAVDFHPVQGCVEIAPQMWALEIPKERRNPDFVHTPPHLVQEISGGESILDPFEDDISFVVEGRRGLSVLLGCAHAGVVNVLEEVSHFFGTREFFSVMGGMHLSRLEGGALEKIVKILAKKFVVRHWFPCHCTGFSAASMLAVQGQNVNWGHVGTVVDI